MLPQQQFKYNWFAAGDIGAAATIVFDNLTILTFISLILQAGYNFPTQIILANLIPGTVVGILVGNLLCFWLSFKLAKREQRQVTAVPFGLDAPSAIGFIVCILGPAFSFLKQQGMSFNQAAINAWHIGIGCLFITGIIKLAFSLFASKLKSFIPQAALLGAIGGVAIALIGFIPLISIFRFPIIGLLALGIVLFTMFAKVRLPFNIAGIPAAIVFGTAIYYVLIPFGLSGPMPNLASNLTFLLPLPSLRFMANFSQVIKFVPIIIPFALLVIFGTMSVVESAACMGEKYKVRDLMVIDGIATIIASLFGGIAQTTPYAGFPAYKKMQARAGFLLINIFIVGIGGILGLVGFIVNLVPESAIAPVLLYVAFEIAMQGFIQCDKKYFAPILLSFFPSIARLVQIKLTDGSLISQAKLQAMCFTNAAPIGDQLIIILLGNGFIITGMLWAATLCFAIDRKWWSSFSCAITLAILSYFGIIHSLYLSGQIYIPQTLPKTVWHIPLELSLGYLSFGLLLIFFAWLNSSKRVGEKIT